MDEKFQLGKPDGMVRLPAYVEISSLHFARQSFSTTKSVHSF
jgi:hypothetical protein